MKIICDFDGTTAINDVGNLLFRTFADDRCYDIVRLWKTGQIDSKECLTRECSIARASESDLDKFALAQELDPTFKAFVGYCNQVKIEVEIASDGLDFYIDRIIRKYDLASMLTIRANHLVFTKADVFRPEFPFFEKGCGECGNCKGFHVRAAKMEHDTVVYVGDGLSDRCGARAADIVFAKRGRELIQFCEDRKIVYTAFEDFADVLQWLKAYDRQRNTAGCGNQTVT